MKKRGDDVEHVCDGVDVGCNGERHGGKADVLLNSLGAYMRTSIGSLSLQVGLYAG